MTTPRLSRFSWLLGRAGTRTAQPFGVCVKACDDTSSKCPATTACTSLFNLRTRQDTGQRACLPTAGIGESCANQGDCGQGARCVRPTQTGRPWRCLKRCGATAPCPKASRCVAAPDDSGERVCATLRQAGETCTLGQACVDGTVCIQSGLPDLPARCLKTCSKAGASCPNAKVCEKARDVEGQDALVCLAQVKLRESCRDGRTCLDPKQRCIRLTDAYALCLVQCDTQQDCAAGEVCESPVADHPFKVCRRRIAPSAPFVALGTCQDGGRALRFDKEHVPVCFTDCTAGSELAPDFCGVLSSLPLLGCHAVGQDLWAVGVGGGLFLRRQQTQQWQRIGVDGTQDLHDLTTRADTSEIWIVDGKGGLSVWSDADKAKPRLLRRTLLQEGKALYGIAALWSRGWLVAVGAEASIQFSDDKGKAWRSLPTPNGLQAQTLRSVALRDVPQGTPEIWIVGDAGVVRRSTDAGKTWTTPKLGNITEGLRRIRFATNKDAPFDAVLVGEKGLLLTRKTPAGPWKRWPLSNESPLHDVWLGPKAAIVVGARGVIRRYLPNQDAWVAPSRLVMAEPLDLFGLCQGAAKPRVVGQRGGEWHSDDLGDNWTQDKRALMHCQAIDIPNSPQVGACLLRCEPKRGGRDCPRTLPACRALPSATNKTPIFVCQTEQAPTGTATRRSACSPYPGALKNKLCAAGTRCVHTGREHFCLRPCSKDAGAKPCPGSERCVFSQKLRGFFCGQEAKAGGMCDLSQERFCGNKAHCVYNPTTAQSRCVALDVQTKDALCLPERGAGLPCEAGLLCAGHGSTPYRAVCRSVCEPFSEKGCPSGWTCLPATQGQGVCVQRCDASKASCSVPTLQCRDVFPTVAQNYCL